MENTKRNPSARRAAGASEFVIVGRRDSQKSIRPLTIEQGGTERELYDGTRHLGTVRETTEGAFVAVIDEQIIGGFATIAEAADAVLDTAMPQVAP